MEHKTIDLIENILNNFDNKSLSATAFVKDAKIRTEDMVSKAKDIIFLGTMTFTEALATFFSEIGKNIYYFDRTVDEGIYNGCPILSFDEIKLNFDTESTLFILASRSGITFYLEIFRSCLKHFNVIPYEPVMLTYPQSSNISKREVYTEKGIKNTLIDIEKNASRYLEILHSLADVESQEILSRILLYRLTFQLELNDGIKSIYPDYMDEDVYQLSPGEVILDAGGFKGDSLVDFLKAFNQKNINNYKYYLFEPSEENIRAAKQIPHDDDAVKYVCAGLGDSKTVAYLSNSGCSSTINSEETSGMSPVQIVTIDNYFKKIPVTFIKMDIEGSETAALRGGREYISKNQPKLAICLYHLPGDILQIFSLIRSFGVDYKYFVRAQRNSVVTEYLLYAVK